MGLCYLPEDRLNQGLFLKQSIQNNVVVTNLRKILTKSKLLNYSKKYEYAKMWVDELNINVPSLEIAVQALSGGNQQRVVIAKWLATDPKVFILDSPTVGIDVNSKSNIHNLIRQLAKKVLSYHDFDEVPEIVHNCNRILVMADGRIIQEVDTVDITEDKLFDLVSSNSKNSEG